MGMQITTACEEQLQAVNRRSWNAVSGTQLFAMDGKHAGFEARTPNNQRPHCSEPIPIQPVCDEPAVNICIPIDYYT